MPQPAKASQETVEQAVDTLFEAGTPLDRITVQAVRDQVGGGSNTSISRHLRPILDAKRAEMSDHQADVLEGPHHETGPVPDAIRRQLDGAKATLDELGQAVSRQIDAAVADERHRQEAARERERQEHRQAQERLQERLGAIAAERDEIADESAEFEDRIADLQETVERLDAEKAETDRARQAAETAKQEAETRADRAETRRDEIYERAIVAERELEGVRTARDRVEQELEELRAERRGPRGA